MSVARPRHRHGVCGPGTAGNARLLRVKIKDTLQALTTRMVIDPVTRTVTHLVVSFTQSWRTISDNRPGIGLGPACAVRAACGPGGGW